MKKRKTTRRQISWKTLVAPKTLVHVGSSRLESKRRHPEHRHDFYECFLIRSGRGTHRLNGRRFELQAGSLFFIRPEDAHSFQAAPENHLSILNLAFPAEILRRLIRRYGGPFQDFWGESKKQTERRLDPRRKEAFEKEAERVAGRARHRLEVERFLLNLAAEIGASSDTQGEIEADPCPGPEWLTRALREIRRPENFVAGPRGFARLCNRSIEHVSRETGRLLGKTPTELVNDSRMEHAAVLLSTGSKKILDVAFDCGFESLAHFYKLFRKRFGETPRQRQRQAEAFLAPLNI